MIIIIGISPSRSQLSMDRSSSSQMRLRQQNAAVYNCILPP
jgi:hypothetical protein